MADPRKSTRLPSDAVLLRLHRQGLSARAIADAYHTGPEQTARSIRHAIEAEQERLKQKGIRAIFAPGHAARHIAGGPYLPGITLPAVSMHIAALREAGLA